MNKMKRLFSVVLALLLTVQLLPLQASAATEGYYTYTVTDGEAEITQCDASISGDVTIPSTLGGYPVTQIGYAAFAECYGLTGVTIPGSVKSIGNGAFAGCYQMTDVRMSEGVTTIGTNAFYQTGLTSVTIPDSVITIGNGAFIFCVSLETVKFGKNVASIGENAFEDCRSLTSVTVPGSVTAIQANTFNGCTGLISVEIGDGVVSIGQDVFYYCTKLESVTIPSSVTKIESGAFVDCSGLTDVYYGGILVQWNKINIEEENNAQLLNATLHYQQAVLPEEEDEAPGVDITASVSYSVEDGKATIYNCDKAVTGKIVIPAEIGGYPVTEINPAAFNMCAGITGVIIPDGVTTIGDSAFYNCTGLERVTIPGSVTHIGNHAFFNCSSLTCINIPDGVTKIGEGTFEADESLSCVKIPASVTSIQKDAFSGCIGMTDVYYVGTQEQWEAMQIAAEGNEQLTAATIHYQYTETPGEGGEDPDVGGDDPDPGEELLTKLLYTISDGKVTIRNCDTSVTGDIVIPAQIEGCPVTQIGSWAFDNCTGLTGVVIPDSVTTIADYAFDNCTGLTGLTIPDSVTSLGQGAFAGCTGLTGVVIGSGIDSLGIYLFDGCTDLVDVAIPVSVTYIDGAFAGCTNLKNVFYAGTREQWDNIALPEDEGNLPLREARIHCNTVGIPDEADRVPAGLYYQVADGQVTITYCDPAVSGELVIPALIEGCPVTQIGESAFQNCTELTGITIPDSVTAIADYAFDNCTNLTGITIPDGVTTIPNCAFRYCYALTDVDFGSGITTIGSNAFVNCTNLTSVTIPDSVTTISDYAFNGCSNLSNMDLGNGLTTIGFHAFGYCSSLNGIVLPDSVTTISDYAFFNCSGLTAINIPDGVTGIGNRAFFGTGLRSVTIPEGITEIGEFVFAMSDLSNVTIPKSVTSIGYRAFWQCYVSTVYYTGTQAQWDAITISDGNDVLLYAILHTQGGLQVQEDGNLLLLGSTEMEELEVLDGQVLDLNGNVLTVDSLASFGQIIDSVGGGGLIVENIEITSNEWLPIQDESGCYRFYEHEAESLGTKTEGSSTVFGFTLDFADSAAYEALAESQDVQITVTLTVGENSQTYAFSRELVAQYVALVAKYPTLRPYMKLTVRGMDTLTEGTAVTVTPTITAIGGKIQVNGESMQYIA